MFIIISSSKLFHYGLKSPQVKDIPEHVSAMTFKEAKLSFPQYPHVDFIYGVVSYRYQLPDNVLQQFHLSDLNKSPEHMKWDDFVEFARERKHKMDLTQFQKDYLLSDGKFAKQNPLFRDVKPSSPLPIQLLAKYTTHKASFAGLKAFWESL